MGGTWEKLYFYHFGGQKLSSVETEQIIAFSSKICSDFSSVGVKPNRGNH